MDREFYDIKLEKLVLICIAHDDNFLTRLYYKGLPDDKIFADQSYRIIYKCITEYYIKYAKLPSKDIVASYIKRIKNLSSNLKEKVVIVVDRVFDAEIANEYKDLFDINYNELVNLYELRLSQNHVKLLANYIDKADISKIKDEIQTFGIRRYDEDVEEFEYADGFKERFERINFFKKNYDKLSPIPTGIDELDNILQGGFLNELVLFAGNSSTGKSAVLHEICSTASKAKKTGILFTIEMDKIEAATRIDSANSDIPLDKFRNPKKNRFGEFNQTDANIWQRKIKEIKKDWGKFFIVAFLNGATVPDIRAKAQEIMKRERIRIDYIAVDYLTDLKPVGNFKSDKDWNVQGEISWDLKLISKGFQNYDGLKGLPVITACTLKKQTKAQTAVHEGEDNRRIIDERDIGISPLLFQHANIVIGIREYSKDINQIIVMKSRGGRKGDLINVYPNWPYGRFHDVKKAAEMIEFQEQEMADSPDGIIVEEE